jgi:chorismate mutase
MMRAVRGATTAAHDDPDEIYHATGELLVALMSENGLSRTDIVSAVFTATPDLSSAFPAQAARDLGWVDVPLLCAVEIDVPRSVKRCIRVLLHAETEQTSLRAVYLRGAEDLRPDLQAAAGGGTIP